MLAEKYRGICGKVFEPVTPFKPLMRAVKSTCRLFKSMLSNYYTYELFRKRYPKEMEEFGRRIARHSFGRKDRPRIQPNSGTF